LLSWLTPPLRWPYFRQADASFRAFSPLFSMLILRYYAAIAAASDASRQRHFIIFQITPFRLAFAAIFAARASAISRHYAFVSPPRLRYFRLLRYY